MLLLSSKFVSTFAETELNLLHLQDVSSFPPTESLHIVFPYAIFMFLSMGFLQMDNENGILKRPLMKIRVKYAITY